MSWAVTNSGQWLQGFGILMYGSTSHYSKVLSLGNYYIGVYTLTVIWCCVGVSLWFYSCCCDIKVTLKVCVLLTILLKCKAENFSKVVSRSEYRCKGLGVQPPVADIKMLQIYIYGFTVSVVLIYS